MNSNKNEAESNNEEKSWYRTLALFSAASMQLVANVWVLAWLGAWLDKQFGSRFIQYIFAFLGLIQGFYFFYKILNQNENHSKNRD